MIFSRCVRCKLSISTFNNRRFSFATCFLKCKASSCDVERFSIDPTPLPNCGVPSLKNILACGQFRVTHKARSGLTWGSAPSPARSGWSSGCCHCCPSLCHERIPTSSARSSALPPRPRPARRTPTGSDAVTRWWLVEVWRHGWSRDPSAGWSSPAWSHGARS